MRRTLVLLSVLSLTAGLFATTVSAQKDEKEAKFEATCPVSGGPAKKESSVRFQGKTVYFCCDNCPKAFQADSKKFASKVKAQWLETAQITQVACPFSGEAVNPDATIALGKAKVAFCCENCLGKAKAAPAAELAAKIFADFDKGFTLQTACPVSGKPLNVEQVVEHAGKKVYFCCPGCPGAFKADPDKFLAKLPQFAKDEEAGKQ